MSAPSVVISRGEMPMIWKDLAAGAPRGPCPETGIARRMHSTEAPVAVPECADGVREVSGLEVGPAHRREPKLGVGRLPKQEVAEPLLTPGANDEVDVSILPGQAPRELLPRPRRIVR